MQPLASQSVHKRHFAASFAGPRSIYKSIQPFEIGDLRCMNQRSSLRLVSLVDAGLAQAF